MMLRRGQIAGLSVALLIPSILYGVLSAPSVPSGTTHTLVEDELSVWTAYTGVLEARNVLMIMSLYQGTATVIELAPEGSKVSRNEILVKFDSSKLESEVIKFERNYSLAASEFESLKNAELPLAIRDLEMELLALKMELSGENHYLKESIQLAEEGLVSEQEIKLQQEKVNELERQLETLELRMQLTMDYLHPSAMRNARAKLESAEQELQLAREQLDNCIIRSPGSGIVVYKPHYFGAEFRTIHIGDSVYPNQPFMFLPDMNDLVVFADVPEAELSKVQEGREVIIQPLAYPDVRLHGAVEKIGSMAQMLPGQPDWQRFFHVVIDVSELDSRLRPGMSVTMHILSHYNPRALFIPRTAISWLEEEPHATVVTRLSNETRKLKLGSGNEKYYEVIEGLVAGDTVLIE